MPGPGDNLEELLARPARFGFVEAVDAALAASPGTVEPGGVGAASSETIRLRPQLDLAFPTADVASARRLGAGDDGRERVRIETTFLGLYGHTSPLPSFFTEGLLADDGGAVRDFLDIFHHRLLSLAWRVMTKYRLERNRAHDGRILALAGFAADAPLPPAPGGDLRAVAGLLARQPHSAAVLGAAIGHWLGGIPIEIEQCTPVWVDLPAERQSMLGEANCGLGADTMAGERIFSRTTAFLVICGPVPASELPRYLPGGDALQAIRALVAECNPERLDWQVEVILAGDRLPPTALGASARLGWDARLDGDPPADVRIRVNPALS